MLNWRLRKPPGIRWMPRRCSTKPSSPSRNVTADATRQHLRARPARCRAAPIAAATIGGVTQTGVHITRWLKLPRRCSKYASPPASTANSAAISA